MTKEEQILDKANSIIEQGLDGETVNQSALYCAIDLLKFAYSGIINMRIEKERIRMECWEENITEKKNNE